MAKCTWQVMDADQVAALCGKRQMSSEGLRLFSEYNHHFLKKENTDDKSSE